MDVYPSSEGYYGGVDPMRIMVAFLIGLVTAATVVALGVLVAQNGQSEQLTFLGDTLHSAAGSVVAGAAVLGFLLACLLLIPGRVATGWHRGAMSRQAQAQGGQLRALREEYARLEGSHQRLLAEHHRVLEHVLVPGAASGERQSAQAAVAPPVAASVAASVTSSASP
jgi:uncharacterized integral membrane protein